MPHDAETEAFVGIGGPIAGSIAAVLVYLAARYTGSQLLLALAYAGFFLNLFNLIPLHPFDGGRITSVISPKIWLVGIPILVALFLWRPSPLLVLVALLAAPKVWEVIRGQHDSNAAYYQTPAATRASYAAQYLGLVVVLAIMSFEVTGSFTRTANSERGSPLSATTPSPGCNSIVTALTYAARRRAGGMRIA
jgi:Zn-dependent protease